MSVSQEWFHMKTLKINFDEIQKAMEDVVRDTFDYYLDLETGEVAAFSEEILGEARSRLYDSESEEIDDDTEYMEFDEEPELPEWMVDEIELALEILLDEERFVRIPERSSGMAFEAMAEFADSVEDPSLREKLHSALDGKGAFRKFKDTLIDYPRQRKRWHGYNAKAIENEITEWLASLGIEVVQ
jgi:hypothetical protein